MRILVYAGSIPAMRLIGDDVKHHVHMEIRTRKNCSEGKLSNGLYKRLGQDVGVMKRTVAAEISRGIVHGASYHKMARQINFKTAVGISNATRIARTEGHRIQVQATEDEMRDGRKHGANQVKQWDASLDSRTRDSHRRVFGEIRELDEKFSNGLMYPGDPNGPAAEVINCRCALLPRARVMLDDDELKRLQERAEYFGLDKTSSFQDFKQKFFDIPAEFVSSQSFMVSNPKRTVEEFTKAAEGVRTEIGHYTSNSSKWSGTININNSMAADNVFGAKEWSCDISVIDNASYGIIWHEMLHSCSASYYSPDVYAANKNIEEASVEFLKLQICKEKGIVDVEAYSDTVNILQVLNDNFGFGSDMDFAQQLFSMPLPDRYQWLEDQVDQKLRDANVSFEDYNDVMGYMQNLQGGDK